MSHQSKKQLRQIDCVTVKGSIEPLELYTCDVDITNLQLDPFEKPISSKEAKLRRVKARIARDKYRKLCFDGQLHASTKFEVDKDLIEMRKPFTQKFYEVFNEGYQHYIKGDWKTCKQIFDTVEEVKGSVDYPTRNLLSFMEESHYVAPKDWEGYRVLTEK